MEWYGGRGVIFCSECYGWGVDEGFMALFTVSNNDYADYAYGTLGRRGFAYGASLERCGILITLRLVLYSFAHSRF